MFLLYDELLYINYSFYMIDPRQSVAILTRIINISISMT